MKRITVKNIPLERKREKNSSLNYFKFYDLSFLITIILLSFRYIYTITLIVLDILISPTERFIYQSDKMSYREFIYSRNILGGIYMGNNITSIHQRLISIFLYLQTSKLIKIWKKIEIFSNLSIFYKIKNNFLKITIMHYFFYFHNDDKRAMV